MLFKNVFFYSQNNYCDSVKVIQIDTLNSSKNYNLKNSFKNSCNIVQIELISNSNIRLHFFQNLTLLMFNTPLKNSSRFNFSDLANIALS